MNVQRVENEPVPELTGEIVSMWPQRTVRGQKGDSTVQTGKFKTSVGETVTITLWNRDAINSSSFFKPLAIKCVSGARGGLIGVKVGKSKGYVGKDGKEHPEELIVEVGDKAEVSWVMGTEVVDMGGAKVYTPKGMFEPVPAAKAELERRIEISSSAMSNAAKSANVTGKLLPHERISQMADLYEVCLVEAGKVAARHQGVLDGSEAVRTVATSFFIQATRENLVVNKEVKSEIAEDDLIF